MFEWIKKRFISKAPDDFSISQAKDGQKLYEEESYTSLNSEAYLGNELVFAAVNKISNSMAEGELVVQDKEGNKVSNYAPLEVLNRPNPIMSWDDLLKTYILHWALSGNFYLVKFRNASGRGKVQEVWPLRPDMVTPVVDANSGIAHYEYKVNGETHLILPADLLHIKTPNALTPLIGVSPLAPAFNRVRADNEANEYVKALLENNARPDLIMVTDQSLNEHVMRRLSAMWKGNNGGGNRGGTAFIDNGFKPIPLSQNLKDLQFADLNNLDETRILMCLGVHPMLIGARSSIGFATFANYSEARLAFWEETVVARQKELSSALNADMDLNPSGLTFKFDNSNVEAFSIIKQRSFDNAIRGVSAGLMTIDEGRAEMGLAALEAPIIPETIEESSKEETKQYTAKEACLDELSCSCSSCNDKSSHKTKNLLNDFDPGELKEALGTLSVADRAYTSFFKKTKFLYKTWGKQINSILNNMTKAIGPGEASEIIGKSDKLREIWVVNAEEELAPLIEDIVKQQAASLGVALNIADPYIEAGLRDIKYILAKSMSETMADNVGKAVKRAFDLGQGLPELKNALKELFVGEGAARRAHMVAQTETMRASNAAARINYKQLGAGQVKWLAVSDSCEYCKALDGKIVGVDDAFVKSGGTITGIDGGTLKANFGDIRDGAAHPNCRCTIVGVFNNG